MTVYKWGAGGAVDAAATTNLTGVVVAGLATGGYVVTWQTGPSATNQSIQGQVYDAAGNAVGGVFTASTGTLDFAPSIAGLSNGGFAISWTDDPTGNGTADTTQTEIYGANNQAISGPTTSTDLFAGDKNDIDSSTVAIPGGDGTGFNVIHFAATGNHFNYAGFSNTSSTGVEGATTPTGTASAVTASTSYSGSEFVAVMIDTIANNPEVDVLFGLFGSFTKVNTTMGTVTPFLADPQVAGLINGDAAVVWQENSGPAPDTDGLSIHGQIMAPNGTKVGSEFTVETEAAGNQQNPSVTALADGGFVVTWQTNASGINYIDGQEYDINGNRVGFEFTVNSQSASGQTNPSISQLADGRLIVAWETPNGVVTGIHSQILDPRNGVIQGPLSGPGATLYGSYFGNSEIIAGSGNNTLIALTGNNLMYGGSGNDVFYGGPGVDTMYGGAGNDIFVINAPAGNVLTGGSGTTTLNYSNFAGGITINLVTDKATAASNGASDTVVGIQGFEMGGGNNTFIAGPGGAHMFVGGVGGVNTLSYAAATSEVYVDLVHGVAYDNLSGALSVDSFANIQSFVGGSGNNVFIAGPGGSHMFNGGVGGVNTLSYAAATSEVYVDLVHGLAYDNLSGPTLTVDSFTNFPAFVGGSGNNTFVGGAGNHVIDGGAGGVNTLDYSAAPGAVSVNLMTGTAVNGYGGTDTFDHMQIFKGGAGQDVFNVGNVQGSYVFVGGGNSDFFAFSGAFGTDTVVDFTAGHGQIYLAQNEFANFAAVQSHAQQVGGNTVITLDASDSITLQGVSLASLNAGMFHFL